MISPAVNDVLENKRPGQALQFESQFGQDFPREPKLRKLIFEELVREDNVLPLGYVSAEEGCIYRVAPRHRRWLSLLRIGLAVCLGAGIAALVKWAGSTVLPETSWLIKTTSWPVAGASYLAMVIGALAHTVLGGIAASRSQTSPLRVPWNDWVLWCNAREMSVLSGVVSLVFVFLFLGITTSELGWTTAFFAGYSVDNLTVILFDRFGKVAAGQAKRRTASAEKANVAPAGV